MSRRFPLGYCLVAEKADDGLHVINECCQHRTWGVRDCQELLEDMAALIITIVRRRTIAQLERRSTSRWGEGSQKRPENALVSLESGTFCPSSGVLFLLQFQLCSSSGGIQR